MAANEPSSEPSSSDSFASKLTSSRLGRVAISDAAMELPMLLLAPLATSRRLGANVATLANLNVATSSTGTKHEAAADADSETASVCPSVVEPARE